MINHETAKVWLNKWIVDYTIMTILVFSLHIQQEKQQ